MYLILITAFLISKDQTKLMRRGKENDKDELMCFDDLYLSSRTIEDLQFIYIYIYIYSYMHISIHI